MCVLRWLQHLFLKHSIFTILNHPRPFQNLSFSQNISFYGAIWAAFQKPQFLQRFLSLLQQAMWWLAGLAGLLSGWSGWLAGLPGWLLAIGVSFSHNASVMGILFSYPWMTKPAMLESLFFNPICPPDGPLLLLLLCPMYLPSPKHDKATTSSKTSVFTTTYTHFFKKLSFYNKICY